MSRLPLRLPALSAALVTLPALPATPRRRQTAAATERQAVAAAPC